VRPDGSKSASKRISESDPTTSSVVVFMHFVNLRESANGDRSGHVGGQRSTRYNK
jgi:hypothetical protein